MGKRSVVGHRMGRSGCAVGRAARAVIEPLEQRMLLSVANDDFASATILTGASVSVTADNADATKETGEPDHAGDSGGASVWWSWTAPADGVVQIDTVGSTFDTILGIYTGSAVSSLSLVGENDDGGWDYTSRVTFDAVAGQTYLIAVDGYGGARGNITLNVESAITVVIPDANLEAAIRSVLEKPTGGITNLDMETLRWFGATSAGIANLSGLEYATNLASLDLYDNQIGDVTPLAGMTQLTELYLSYNQISDVTALLAMTQLNYLCMDNNQISDLTPLAGLTQLYYVGVGYNDVDVTSGSASMGVIQGWMDQGTEVTYLPQGPVLPPANDDLASATILSGASVSVIGDNIGATKEAGEPDHAGNGGGASVWWSWTATADGVVRIDTSGSSFDTMLGVYTGTTVGSLLLVAQDDNGGADLTSRVTFNAISGRTYRIAVDGYRGETGNITLKLERELTVSIPDAHLAAAIRSKLRKPVGVITNFDMETLTQFSAEGAGIANLSGLQYATNLQNLYLDDNQISDLSPLAGLTQLTWLDLCNNQVSDMTPLSGLTQLTILGGLNNQISDVTPLAGLTQLRHLSLRNNQISDVTPLTGLTQLITLQLSNNRISDVMPLAGLTQVYELYLRYNQIGDVVGLSGLTNMSWLYLDNNQIRDVAPLAGMTHLYEADVSHNGLDVTPGSASMNVIQGWMDQGTNVTYLPQNAPPTEISLSDSGIAENQPLGVVVGSLGTMDADAGDTFTYSLVGGAGSGDNSSFNISGDQLLTAGSFDFEGKCSYSIRVRTTDHSGLSFEKVFIITVTDVDEIAPTVTAVYVRGSTWNTNYLSFLAANMSGSSSTYGYAIPVGSGSTQLQTLPWRNLNRISIAFSEDVSISQAQFAIVGSVGSYSVSGFSYNSTDRVATWSLSAVIGADKLYVAVPGSGATPVTDAAGNILDGEWTNPTDYSQVGSTSTFPSGDGTAGGSFAFRFDVLPGDSTGGSLGKVNVADINQTKSRSSLPETTSSYRSDFDGNNQVNVADITYVKSRSSISSLPVNPPLLPTFGPVFSQVSLLALLGDGVRKLW